MLAFDSLILVLFLYFKVAFSTLNMKSTNVTDGQGSTTLRTLNEDVDDFVSKILYV